MKKKLSFLFSFLVIFQHSQSQSTIDVADNTLKVKGHNEEIFYYGFAEGDQLIFNFQEVNGKELKEVEILEFPSSSKFMDYKTDKIENKIINITKTAIYKFRFANSSLSGRICKFKIQRVPANETTKNFNTSVYWKTIYDTVYSTVKEKYLVRKEYKSVSVSPSSKYYINSGRNAILQGGKSRISLPIVLPKNTVEWYYTFSASRNEEVINKTKETFNIAGELSKIVDPTGILNIGIDLLTKPPGGDVCDIYLLDATNRNSFEAKTEYKCYPEGSRENIMSGVIQIKKLNFSNLYLGIKNPDSGVGIFVAIEIAAIVLEEEWGLRDVQKTNINSKEEAYLRN